MVLDMFLLYNLTEFLRALAYCLSKAFALCGSSFFPLRKLELAFNPTELIGELQFTNCESLLHDDMTEPHSLDFLRTYLFFVVSSHLPSLPCAEVVIVLLQQSSMDRIKASSPKGHKRIEPPTKQCSSQALT